MPTNVLVSGAPERIAPVSKVLRDHDCTVVEVADLANVPAACQEAGENAFDAYLQMPAYFALQGTTALERLHHFYAKGVMARFPAMNAVIPTLKPGGRITVVAWPLPAEVDAGDDLFVRVLGSGTSPEDIVLAALGRESIRTVSVESLSGVSYADWRVELLGLVTIES